MMDYRFTCEMCPAEKGAENDWFAVWAMNALEFKVFPWEEANETGNLESYDHICGQECLHKRLSQWLEANKT
jgi:hypothetical protein